jgi:hypothetical protein
VDKFFRAKINDSFWEQYGNKRNYKKWDMDISWSRVVFANTWHEQGSQKLTEKAARLGHPQAKKKLRDFKEETRRIKKQNIEQNSDYNPDYHRFSLTHNPPRYGYPLLNSGYRPGSLSYYARAAY